MDLLQPNYWLMIATLAIVVGVVVGAALSVRWILRQAFRGRRSDGAEALARESVVRLSERVEDIADETRRLAEGQRFFEQVLTDRKEIRDQS